MAAQHVFPRPWHSAPASVGAVAIVCCGLLLALDTSAQQAVTKPGALSIFDGADLELGLRLIEEHACNTCHARHQGGNGTAICRPAGTISSPGALRGMVEYCNTQLNLGMFPEEVTSVAAVLQRDFYRFARSTPIQKEEP
jgi:hypothetical protein